MGQEFTINSPEIESTINDLLPSQGGYGVGIDFSASTMIIPIIDVTPSAEGSILRSDLQSSFSLTNSTNTLLTTSSQTLINTTGYFRCVIGGKMNDSGIGTTVSLTDGTTTKIIWFWNGRSGAGNYFDVPFSEYDIFLGAGDSLIGIVSNANSHIRVLSRQIADITGTLSTPT